MHIGYPFLRASQYPAPLGSCCHTLLSVVQLHVNHFHTNLHFENDGCGTRLGSAQYAKPKGGGNLSRTDQD